MRTSHVIPANGPTLPGAQLEWWNASYQARRVLKNIQCFVDGQHSQTGRVAPPGTLDIMHSHVS